MRHNHTAHRVALSLLLGSVAIPAAAQQAQPVTPPILTPAPAPVETPTAAPTASPSITFAPQAPVVQAVPPPPAPPPEAAATEAPAQRAAPARQRTTQVQQRTVRTATSTTAPPAPSTAAPAAAIPAVTQAPQPEPTSIPSPEATASAAPAPAPAVQPAQEEMSSGAAWAMLAIPLIAILALGALLVSRRRRARAEAFEDTYYEPVEETVVAQPVAVAPIVAADEETASRPWIDIGLRPIRAEDSLEVEVTVSNSGDAPARDVRVSTWMLNGAESSQGEQALIEARSGSQIATVDVAAGGDKSVDTTVALPGDAPTPILVAEARYPLPQGGEGRIAATFEIDVTEGDVEARLHDVLERA